MTAYNVLLTRLYNSPAYKRMQSTYCRQNMEIACANAAIRRWNRVYRKEENDA